ncbi:biotin/lipoate--protein ligase family protein [Pararhizobium haloflavum]|uniref:biotin/lipoate--protein ligase family protein n=1 Tax=Pararhizobium haloflavum TaxID=2037914 RepID=UPI000C187905|nr:biotin/lipoate--protein ligase family protein [Pararhizobium haloflavum]
MLADAETSGLLLPPLFEAVAAQRPETVFDEACRVASQDGAGALVHAKSESQLALAVTFEPDRPLRQARFIFFAGMAALGDALAAHCPPERGIRFRWPDSIVYDGALLGGGWLAASPVSVPEETPDWMVFGAQLIAARPGLVDTGQYPGSISLQEEEITETKGVLESFARHLMRYVDAWQNEGAGAITKPYLERLVAATDHEQTIDGHGDLLERDAPSAAPTRQSLLGGLDARIWFDPLREGPKW